MKCKDCKYFEKCDEVLFKTSGVHLSDDEHNCLEFLPKKEKENGMV